MEEALGRVKRDVAPFRTVLVGSLIAGNYPAPAAYADHLTEELSKITGLSLAAPQRKEGELTNCRTGSARLMELCADLRILAMVYQRFVHGFFIYGSGPHAGLAEIALPAIAPGSTIMPGKINPSSNKPASISRLLIKRRNTPTTNTILTKAIPQVVSS